MTAKRFEYKNHKVYDNLTGEVHSSNMVSVNVLNELHEENQSSKEFIEQLQEELVLFKEAGANMGIDLNAQIIALKQENEQLKQKIKSIKEILIKDMGYVESFEKIEEILK